jgi:dihydroorotate dehydrogenase (fumarate)
MNLTTRYLGLELAHPIVPGASPLVDDLDTVRQLEDAGAAAIVMHSLFEEQLVGDQAAAYAFLERPAESYAEALSYLPSPPAFRLGPDQYLEQLAAIKRTVSVPVIASLNGTSFGYWLETARDLESAGADAIELNVYRLPTDLHNPAEALEKEAIEMVFAVRQAVRLPLAVKLSPFYTALGHVATRLVNAGADGVVLFNRFYQPDLDIEKLEVARQLTLSDSSDLLLRLRWLAILHGRLHASLAASGGVHTVTDVVKALMAGADVVQTVSLLLRQGPQALTILRDGLARWMEEHEYTSVGEMRGCLSLAKCPDPAGYERANYVHLLQNWQPEA